VLAEVLDKGGAGGICVASHLVGTEMRRMIDEPDLRQEIHANLAPVFEALAVTTNPIPVKTAMRLLGHRVGGLRLPMIEASDEEEEVIRGALEQHGLLSAV
jgi:4-hydroxy-tetrahydrodipicolinate synthase